MASNNKFIKTFYSNDVSNIITPSIDSIKSRYDYKYRINTDNTVRVRPLHKTDLVPNQNISKTMHEVSVTEQFRPEIIAYNFYNDSKLYWVIMAFNNIKFKEELYAGRLIALPDYHELFSSNGVMMRR